MEAAAGSSGEWERGRQERGALIFARAGGRAGGVWRRRRPSGAFLALAPLAGRSMVVVGPVGGGGRPAEQHQEQHQHSSGTISGRLRWASTHAHTIGPRSAVQCWRAGRIVCAPHTVHRAHSPLQLAHSPQTVSGLQTVCGLRPADCLWPAALGQKCPPPAESGRWARIHHRRPLVAAALASSRGRRAGEAEAAEVCS